MNQLNEDEAKKDEFLDTPRAVFIISQALYIAIKELEKVPKPYAETSNISDMKYLLENAFPIYPEVAKLQVDLGTLGKTNHAESS